MKKYIIFGAGQCGSEALLYYGIENVAYFCDNRKYGKRINGLEIISFDDLCSMQEKYIVILAVFRHEYRMEMQEQLEEQGIEYKVFCGIEGYRMENNFSGEYEFTDRSASKEKLLMILAGYKEYLWDSVFERVNRYLPEDMDVCVMTAGYENKVLKELCQERGWSYLYTYENKVSLPQNLTIRKHPSAKWIYKMDEDIFITHGLFNELLDTYLTVKEEKKYDIGIVAPLMAVNGYGYRRCLEYLQKLSEYEARFEPAVFGRGAVYNDPQAAEYLWELTLPINEFARNIRERDIKYSVCFHRFSIGCFMMARCIWEQMGGFMTAPEGVLGSDEEYLCKWCMNTSRAVIVAERAYAGHFSFGPQTEEMRKFYEQRKNEF